MMTTSIPKASIKEIQKLQRAFNWGDSDEKHHLHTMRWSEIALPKNQGELGIMKLELMN